MDCTGKPWPIDKYERTKEKTKYVLYSCLNCQHDFVYNSVTSIRKRCIHCNGYLFPYSYVKKKTVPEIMQNKLKGYETGAVLWDEQQYDKLHNAFVAASTGAETLAMRRPREMVHDLKIEKKYYDRILSGEKTFEIRYNDRDYQTGDQLKLNMIPKNGERCDNKPILKEIAYIHSGLGMQDNYIVIGLKDIG